MILQAMHVSRGVLGYHMIRTVSISVHGGKRAGVRCGNTMSYRGPDPLRCISSNG